AQPERRAWAGDPLPDGLGGGVARYGVRDIGDGHQFAGKALAAIILDQFDRGEPEQSAGEPGHAAVQPEGRVNESGGTEIALHGVPSRLRGPFKKVVDVSRSSSPRRRGSINSIIVHSL